MEKHSTAMIPWLGHGHVSFPTWNWPRICPTKIFHIYFCSTPINLSSINHDIEESYSIQLVKLQLPSLPELPPQLHTTKNVPPNLIPKLVQLFKESGSSFFTTIASLKPNLLIYDAFQPWAATIASSLGVPAVHFATLGAAPYAFLFHILTQGDTGFPYEARMCVQEHEKENLQELRLRLGDKTNRDSAFSRFGPSQEIILMKTCRTVVGKYIDYLSDLCNKKVVPVGALVTQDNNTEEDHSEIIKWLGEKPPFSTVFISFGSENYFTRDQMQEIAKGLEYCQVNLIWVVRFPLGKKVGLEETLPQGFLDRVKQRGRIMEGWAPQTKILAHPSIGAFISHCGFSSTNESIYFGVPVIRIALKLDQPFNAKLLMEAGVGVEVERDGNGHFSGEDISNAVNKVMVEKTGQGMRERASELSTKMKNEQQNAVNEAAEELKRIFMEHKQQKQ